MNKDKEDVIGAVDRQLGISILYKLSACLLLQRKSMFDQCAGKTKNQLISLLTRSMLSLQIFCIKENQDKTLPNIETYNVYLCGSIRYIYIYIYILKFALA